MDGLSMETLHTTHRYRVALLDPPWPYKCWNGKSSRTADSHYAVMTLEQICNLPIANCLERDAVVFLWVTSPMLACGLQALQRWFLEYVTIGFTWIKTTTDGANRKMGMGHHTRPESEICLLARRGRGLKRKRADVRQVIEAPVREHSRKPDETYQRIEQLYGDVPRIELFARHTRPGWSRWGFEAPPQEAQCKSAGQ